MRPADGLFVRVHRREDKNSRLIPEMRSGLLSASDPLIFLKTAISLAAGPLHGTMSSLRHTSNLAPEGRPMKSYRYRLRRLAGYTFALTLATMATLSPASVADV